MAMRKRKRPEPGTMAAAVLDAVRALPEGSIMRTARDAGIGYRTIYRLRSEPDYTPSVQTLEGLRAALGITGPATAPAVDRYAREHGLGTVALVTLPPAREHPGLGSLPQQGHGRR